MTSSDKEKIIRLIKLGKFPEAFDLLGPHVPEDKKVEYETLADEFIHPPANYSEVTYKMRLIVFVNKLKIEEPQLQPDPELDFYDELCRLGFTIQTDNYVSIIPYKPVVAFLLHGNSDADGNDIKWLSKQLLHREQNLYEERKFLEQIRLYPERTDIKRYRRIDDIVTIDCSIWSSVEAVFEQLFTKYNIKIGNYTQLRNQLGSTLREKLSHGHVICVMKNADCILNDDTKLSTLFNDLLVFMEGHIVRQAHENSLIFLFTNNGEARFKPQNGNYFFWFGDAAPEPHAIGVVKCKTQRIIDLEPIRQLQCCDVTTWIDDSIGRPKVYNKVKKLSGREDTVVGQGPTARPFEVIRNICTDLEIKFEEKWIN